MSRSALRACGAYAQRTHGLLPRRSMSSRVVVEKHFQPDPSKLTSFEVKGIDRWRKCQEGSALVHDHGYLLMHRVSEGKDPLDMVSTRHFIHFIFVDEQSRRTGVATQLLAELSGFNLHALTAGNDGADALFKKCGFSFAPLKTAPYVSRVVFAVSRVTSMFNKKYGFSPGTWCGWYRNSETPLSSFEIARRLQGQHGHPHREVKPTALPRKPKPVARKHGTGR